jgi:hypothetical protein
MNNERLKLIVKNLELLVDSLKKEINLDPDPDPDTNYSENISQCLGSLYDYDEVFVEEDY